MSSTSGVKHAASTELFHNDVPVIRTSLVRHGLVESSASPLASRSSIEPLSSEDLTTADEEDDGWARIEEQEDEEAFSRVGDRASKDVGLRALLGVNSVVVGHARAAEELQRVLLSPPRGTLRSPPPPSPPQFSNSSRKGAVDASTGAGKTRRVPSALAGAVASAALAAARRGTGRPIDHMKGGTPGGGSGNIVEALAAARRGTGRPIDHMKGGTPGGGSGNIVEDDHAPHAPSTVSMASVMDITVNVLGNSNISGGRGPGTGRRDSSNVSSNGSNYNMGKTSPVKKNDEGMATFTVDVPTRGSLTLGIGVKEMGGGCVMVEELHRPAGGLPGPAERAGVALGDVILGINYEPLERGLVHTADTLADAIKLAGFVKLQISRAVSGGMAKWRQSLPGRDCPIVTELMWRAAQLRKAGVLSSSERNVINGLILKRMAWEDGTSMGPQEPPRTPAPLSALSTAPVPSQVKRAASAQLDSMVLQVKRIREALHVRCLHAKATLEPTRVSSVWGPPGESETSAAMERPSRITLRYVLRVEDVATGREWLVFPRYCDFSKLHQELLAMWPPIADLPFPVKRPMSRMLLGAVLEERIVALEVFLQGALSLLGVYAAIDPRSAGCLHLIQDFLGIPKDLFPAETSMTPTVVDQKRAELLLYKLLNQGDSPAARMKHLLMRDFERDASKASDVESLMNNASSRLWNLKEFVLEQHEQQLLFCVEGSSSHPCGSNEAKRTTIRKAVRRQVELALYLPLRRCLWKELGSRLKGPARRLQRAIRALRQSSPSVFGVETPGIFSAREWGPAKEAMGQATRRVLPTDQIEGLHRAAEHIAALHSSLLQATSSSGGGANDILASPVDKNPFSSPEHAVAVGETERPTIMGKCFEGEVEARENGSFVRDSMDEGASRARSALFRRSANSDDVMDFDCATEVCRPQGFIANGSSAHLHRQNLSPPECGGEADVEASWRDRTRADGESRPIKLREGVDRAAEDPMVNGGNTLNLFKSENDCGVVEEVTDGSEEVENNKTSAPTEAPQLQRARSSGISGSRCWRASSHNTDISSSPERSNSISTWVSAGDEGTGSSDDVEIEEEEGVGSEKGVQMGSMDVSGREDDPLTMKTVKSAAAAAAAAGFSRTKAENVMGADDFLPLFALALVHSAPLDLLLPQTLLTHLMDAEGSLSEAGYLVATLEAAVSFVAQVYESNYCSDGEPSSL